MGALDFFTVYLIGEDFKFPKWNISKWITALYHLIFLLCLIKTTLFVKASSFVLKSIQNSRVYIKNVYRMKKILNFIPILGNSLTNFLVLFENTLNNDILPFLTKMKIVLPIMVHVILIKICFIENNNIDIFFTGESEELLLFCGESLLTTLILSNHRSINDYLLIAYITLYSSGPLKESDTFIETFFLLWENNQTTNNIHFSFLSWGTVFQIPTRKFFKNILLKDENITMDSKNIKQFIQANGENVFLLFPEVNILTTELAMIQRKLNHVYYPFVNKYYNVLSPRFNQFINILKSFKDVICLPSLSNRNPNWQEQKVRNANNNQLKKKKQILELSNSLVSTQKEKKSILFNKFLYDVTIVYYSPILVTKGHNHDTGNLKTINGIQIQEINPSFFKIFQCRFDIEKNNTSPVIIIIDIKRHPIATLLSLKEKKLEKWLEMQWIRKDSLINSLHSNITVE
ncbi:Mum3p PWA37_001427 [Arxiozyma heterogenica]|uniref:Mum3p n=1 Tax=Arxiozyma heterogenica TaxID=278026 RepID=UPI002EFE081D